MMESSCRGQGTRRHILEIFSKPAPSSYETGISQRLQPEGHGAQRPQLSSSSIPRCARAAVVRRLHSGTTAKPGGGHSPFGHASAHVPGAEPAGRYCPGRLQLVQAPASPGASHELHDGWHGRQIPFSSARPDGHAPPFPTQRPLSISDASPPRSQLEHACGPGPLQVAHESSHGAHSPVEVTYSFGFSQLSWQVPSPQSTGRIHGGALQDRHFVGSSAAHCSQS